jgi:hypothetical protein
MLEIPATASYPAVFYWRGKHEDSKSYIVHISHLSAERNLLKRETEERCRDSVHKNEEPSL